LQLIIILSAGWEVHLYNSLKLRIPGDVMIGAMFPVHEQPTVKTAFSRRCGKVREQYGIHRIEVLIQALNKINQNPNILPGVKVGVDVRDTCWFEPVALEQCMDFIRTANNYSENICTPPGSSEFYVEKPIAALIGPGSSEMSKQVQQVLQIFDIPQIGYSATAASLSDVIEYRTFIRVVPSDALQVKVIASILRFFQWTYVILVNSQGLYGEKGILALKNEMQSLGICAENELSIDNKETHRAFILLARQLFNPSNKAKVVVCFCQGETVGGIFKAMTDLQLTRKGYMLIGSDGWADRTDILGAAAQGGLSIRIRSKSLPEFNEYFMNLTPQKNTWNPWFKAFWEQKFDCSLNASVHSSKKQCAENSSLCSLNNDLTLRSSTFEQDNKLGLLNTSIYTVALALHKVHSIVCGEGFVGVCDGFLPIDGDMLRSEILKTRFYDSNGDLMYFDKNGDPPGRYWNILQLKVVKQRSKACCWICKTCLPNERVIASDQCEKCPLGYKPTENRTECTKIEPIYPHWSRPLPLLSIILASLGVLLTMFGLSVFLIYRNTSIVKASTRELMYVMLLGMLFAHASNFVVIWKPVVIGCLLSRVFPGLAFSMLYGALATKTNRIARILEGSKRIYLKKQRFLSLTAQLVITALINLVEVTVVVVMLFLEPPGPELRFFNSFTMARLICNTTRNGTVIPLAIGMILIVVCTCYAIKTRNLPHNFNEAKFIGFTMYTTCVLWLAILPIYLGGYETEFALSMAVSLSATIAFLILFIPKIYIMLLHPEKNSRSAFVTAKDIRCHIGVLQANISQKHKNG
uniref:G_PROTEIN_RECEP_F3_4 domain-containing protein n=1 Tax=Schistocephalus solidus TaxID=70667 RepID=A0A183SEB6_SCHSO